MAIGIFGGDTTMSHYTVNLPHSAYRGKGGAEERKLAYRALKEAQGGRERYFQFKTKDEKAKAKAKAECEKWAAMITEKTGLKVEVKEGFFL